MAEPLLFPEMKGGPWTKSAPRPKPAPSAEREEQRQELARVEGSIGAAVLAFARERLASGGEFRMEELRAYIDGHIPSMHGHAPDSAGRILRQLRQQGALRYEVVSRSESLYRVTEVGGGAA